MIKILALAITLTGCANTAEWARGTSSHDPHTGDWIFIQNEPLAAQRQAYREQGWRWGDEKPPQY